MWAEFPGDILRRGTLSLYIYIIYIYMGDILRRGVQGFSYMHGRYFVKGYAKLLYIEECYFV